MICPVCNKETDFLAMEMSESAKCFECLIPAYEGEFEVVKEQKSLEKHEN